jgi:hypothetical protein
LQAIRIQPAIFAPLGDVQHVAGNVLADHVPGFTACPMHAADTEAIALAEGVVHHTLMFTDPLAIRRAHVTGTGRDVSTEKFTEIAFANEADAG